MRRVAEQKAEEVRAKIERLEEMLEVLESLAHLCPGDIPSDQRPFLEVLSR